MGMFDGLAGPTPTTTTQTNSNVGWLQPYWQKWLSNVSNITPSAMPVYGGPTVAPMNNAQNTAIDMMGQFATNGTPAGNAANGAITNIASGTTNPYEGQNPALQSMIDQSNADIAKAYSVGTAAQTDSAAARNGAYGGTGYQEQTGLNQQALGHALAENTSGLQYQNYLNSGNLYNQDRNAQLQASQLGLASQGVDQNAINGLFGLGSAQQGNTQSVLGSMQNYFNQQTQAPFAASSILGNALSQASGAPATTTSSTQQGAPGIGTDIIGVLSALFGPSLFGG